MRIFLGGTCNETVWSGVVYLFRLIKGGECDEE